MHIVVQGSPQFWVEDDGTLKTPDGEFSVRVFNIVREEAEEAENDETAGDIPTFRVGLERLGPIERTDDPDEFDQPKPEPKKTAAVNGEKKARISPLSVLALAIVAAMLVGAAIVWQTHSANWPFSLGSKGPNQSAGDKADLPSGAEQPGSADQSTSLRIAAELLAMPGAVPFAQPEVAKKLGLTPTQADAIQRLNKITLEAVNDLEKYWGSGDRWELAQKRTMLLEEARQHALQLLTSPQRERWDKITK